MRPLSLALTGNIAAGKSTVARLLEAWGATVLDADALVHELQQPGTPVFDDIAARFGPRVLTPDGRLDRAALRQVVLDDPVARHALEAIVHPAVAALRARRHAEAASRGDPIIISDIPLLFEAADPGAFDGVILVDAPVAERRRRLVVERGLDPGTAGQLMAAQQPAAGKRARSTWIIENDADRATLELRTRAVWDAIRQEAARRR